MTFLTCLIGIRKTDGTHVDERACYRAAMGKAQDMERLKGKLSFKERLAICAQHWANSIRCALEDCYKDMLVLRFEDLLLETKRVLRQICEHVELEFDEDMLPAPHHKTPFGSRLRDRWYPLSLDRALHYIQKATSEELRVIEDRRGPLAKDEELDIWDIRYFPIKQTREVRHEKSTCLRGRRIHRSSYGEKT